MADQREGGIAWTEETWNPLRGCSRVSEGCRNCYAESVAGRFSGPGQPYEGLVRLSAEGKHGRPRWNGTIRFVPEKLAEPLRWTRPRMVFVNSMSDLFHDGVTNEQIAAIFGVMAASPRHTFQVLTKRPVRALEFFRWLDVEAPIGVPSDPDSPWWRVLHCFMAAFNAAKGIDAWALAQAQRLLTTDKISGTTWPLPNVWLGVSVEDQKTADARIPLLLDTPAAVRWVSYEPALGPVDFDLPRCDVCGEASDCLGDDGATPFCNEHEQECSYGHWLDFNDDAGTSANGGITWVVVGGESGPGARPFDLAWARSVIAQCREAGTACFVKQLGAKPIADHANVRGLRWAQVDPRDHGHGDDHVRVRLTDRKGGDPSEWPEDLRVREWPEVPRG